MIYHLLVKLWGWLQLPAWLQWRLVSLWTPKYRVAVAAILMNAQQQILLCEHTYRRDYPWGLPGGSLKAREDPVQAMEREIFEETGLKIRVDRPLMAISAVESPQISIIYLCCLSEGESAVGGFQPNAEVSRIQFFDSYNLPDLLLPSEREIIQNAMRIIHEHA